MDLEKFARPEVVAYLYQNSGLDLTSFLLKKSPFADITIQELAQQIKGKSIAEKKFPEFLQEGIVFPPNLNLEQSSSASTAIYKSKLLAGNSFLDLTTGFGIDAFYLSNSFQTVTLIEQNEQLLQMVKHNWTILGRSGHFIAQDLNSFIKENQKRFDVIYLDPARRSSAKKKVFLLEDLSPNILEIQDALLEKSSHLMTKLSPMIDLSYLISVLKNLFRIDIIAVKNEVKEIVVHQSFNIVVAEAEVNCINLETEQITFKLKLSQEKIAKVFYSEPEKYIYLPNTAILKGGCFNLISEKLKVAKLHPNTHLYTSQEFFPHFPGRILKMERISSKQIKKGDQWNIISKNYPLSTAQIEIKYKIKQGGANYLIFTRTLTEMIILKSI